MLKLKLKTLDQMKATGWTLHSFAHLHNALRKNGSDSMNWSRTWRGRKSLVYTGSSLPQNHLKHLGKSLKVTSFSKSGNGSYQFTFHVGEDGSPEIYGTTFRLNESGIDPKSLKKFKDSILTIKKDKHRPSSREDMRFLGKTKGIKVGCYLLSNAEMNKIIIWYRKKMKAKG